MEEKILDLNEWKNNKETKKNIRIIRKGEDGHMDRAWEFENIPFNRLVLEIGRLVNKGELEKGSLRDEKAILVEF